MSLTPETNNEPQFSEQFWISETLASEVWLTLFDDNLGQKTQYMYTWPNKSSTAQFLSKLKIGTFLQVTFMVCIFTLCKGWRKCDIDVFDIKTDYLSSPFYIILWLTKSDMDVFDIEIVYFLLSFYIMWHLHDENVTLWNSYVMMKR